MLATAVTMKQINMALQHRPAYHFTLALTSVEIFQHYCMKLIILYEYSTLLYELKGFIGCHVEVVPVVVNMSCPS